MELTEAIARKVLDTVDAGLSYGLGTQEPGRMCVEAAVCFALGMPHGDNPPCVGTAVRAFKIRLNDSAWSSPEARAKGMRKLSVVQLGSDQIDQNEFARLLVKKIIRVIVPVALRAAASIHEDEEYRDALELSAKECEEAADSADSAARAAYRAADSADSADSAAKAARAAYRAADSADSAAKAADRAADSADSAARAAYSAYSAYRAADSADSAAKADRAADSADSAARAAYSAAKAADSAARAADSADSAARAAYSAAKAAYRADSADSVLSLMADIGVQILVKLNAPGRQWLPLAE